MFIKSGENQNISGKLNISERRLTYEKDGHSFVGLTFVERFK